MSRFEHDGIRLFQKEYRMLSFVPRWSIAPRLFQQSGAEHSFFVALYSSQLCDFFDLTAAQTMVIVGWALRHDAPEIWTGDPPGPGKGYFIDEVKLATYIDSFATHLEDFGIYRRLMASGDAASVKEEDEDARAQQAAEFRTQAVRLIKVADLIDECMYLRYELAMGNTLIKDVFNLSMERLRAKCEEWSEETAEYLLRCVQHELSRIEAEGALIPILKP